MEQKPILLTIIVLVCAVFLSGAAPVLRTEWVEAPGFSRAAACRNAREACVTWEGKLRDPEDPCECREMEYGGYACRVRCLFPENKKSDTSRSRPDKQRP